MSRTPTHDSTRQPIEGTDHERGDGHGGGGSYARFAAMIATSTVVMFALTYTNSMQVFGHLHVSQERIYMAMLMGGMMAIVMLAFMWRMYGDTRANVAVLLVALLVAGTGLFLSRSQALVDDSGYMGGMIPHHSIAILTSQRACIEDVRVRELADAIIVAQRKEIAEMEWLLDDIAANGRATTAEEAAARPVPEFTGSVDPTRC